MKKIQMGITEKELLSTKISPIQTLLNQTNQSRAAIINAVNQNELQAAMDQKEKYVRAILELQQQLDSNVLIVAELAIQYFHFQLAVSGEFQAQAEKQLFKKLNKLPKLDEVWSNISQSIILSTSLLQLQLKKIINNKTFNNSDLYAFQKYTRELASKHPITKRYSKYVMTIISHLRLYHLNMKSNHQKKIIEICEMLLRDQKSQTRLLTLQTKVVLLYNCLKTLIGVRNFSQAEDNALSKLYEAFRVKTVSKYHQHLLHLFFIIKAFIFRKSKALQGNEDAVSSEDEEQEFFESGAAQKLSNWTSASLDQTFLALQEAERSIIRHRVASLATVIGLKLGLPRFCLNFLQLMHDGPFNDESQTIKLCFQLFQAREYQRLKACLQGVLSSPSCKNLREREVLVSMCAIFEGLFLGDRQGALLYAKLNHFQNKKLILRQQTLLQHVGLAYLNLASHQPYLCNRQVFQQQALAVLKQSSKVNPQNYVTQYCLGKLLLTMGDAQKAYEHAKQSIMSGRGEWVPYSLLACIYFCQRKITKALTLIQQLTKKYKGAKNLYYIKAYLEVNRLLLEVEHDEEVQAAKDLRQDIFELTRERVLKSKSPENLLKYLQEYHQASLRSGLTQFDQKYFYNIPVFSFQGGVVDTFIGGYHEAEGEKTILHIIPLLLEAGQIGLAEILIKGLPTSPQKTYKLALLHQVKKQIEQAIIKYKLVLSQQPYHTPSLINLSLLESEIGDALHYLQLAQKFVSNSKLWLAKGILLSKQGRIAEANEYLIKQGETGWLQHQPQLLYYY